jgi:hypothetical protein
VTLGRHRSAIAVQGSGGESWGYTNWFFLRGGSEGLGKGRGASGVVWGGVGGLLLMKEALGVVFFDGKVVGDDREGWRRWKGMKGRDEGRNFLARRALR